MATTLKASTKILELANEFPFLFDTLIEISPRLKRLQNPILQRTIGKRATLTDVSKMSKVPLNRLFVLLSESIYKTPMKPLSLTRKPRNKTNGKKNLIEDRGN